MQLYNDIEKTSKLTDEYIKQYESIGLTGNKKRHLKILKRDYRII